MEEFAEVKKAREAYAVFADAMKKGRDILVRAGIAADPPPIPEFDAVFRRLNPGLRQELYNELRKLETITPPDALRIWQPLLRKAAS